jgi:UDP:flavonoid glycosyltransferase YjiC (YdhE family)
MVRVLMSVAPGMGHINPALPVAKRLVERGHQVWFQTGSKFADRVEATGARFVPSERLEPTSPPAGELSRPPIAATSQWARWGPRGLCRRVGRRLDRSLNRGRLGAYADARAAFNAMLEATLIRPMPDQLREYRIILEQFPADVIVVDLYCLGAMALHELGGPPWATLGVTAMMPASPDTPPPGTGLPPATTAMQRAHYGILSWLGKNVVFRPLRAALDRERAHLGLPPIPRHRELAECFFSPFLHIQGTTSAYEFSTRFLPPQVHLVGPLLPVGTPDFAPPAWWPDLDSGRATILVTQGTVRTSASNLVLPTLRALADDDVLVVAAIPDVEALGPLPPNARAESFIPYDVLLPRVDVLVTNGGYLGVQTALAHGVPMVIAGTTEDKRDIGVRVAWHGAGIDLGTDTPTPEQIGQAVRAVLSDPSYRDNARRLQADFAQHDGPTTAATLIEELAHDGRPIVRAGRFDDTRHAGLRPLALAE